MIATKYTNYIQIEGLEEHSQAYDENSFILRKLNGSSVLFTLEIVSPTNVKLILAEPNNDEFMILLTNINGVEKSTILVRREEDKPIVKPPEPVKPIEEEKIDFYFNKDFMVLRKSGGTDNLIKKNDISIEIKKYTLERFDDFPDEVIIPEMHEDLDGNIVPDLAFKIELDRIYRIKIVYKGKVIVKDYIHEKPTCYYSSIYHIKQLANGFDLVIKESGKTDFDLKLLIWKYSRMAVSIAGITGDVIYEHKNSLLNDYVGKRAFLEIITKAVRDSNLTPEKAKESLGSIAVSLADLSHGAATTETITTQLLKVHKSLYTDIKEYEEQLREYFSYLQATDTISNTRFKAEPLRRVESFNPHLRRGRKYR